MKHLIKQRSLMYAILATIGGAFSLYSFFIGNTVIGIGAAFLTFVGTLYAIGGDS